MTQKNVEFTDETLTAYLDGELDGATVAVIRAAVETDPDLARRLDALHVPLDQLRAVFAPEVLGAPQMPAHLAATMAAPQPAPANSPQRPRFLMPLTLTASFLVGMVATTLITPLPETPQVPQQLGWIASVASYHALYTPETLGGADQAADVRDAVLARAEGSFDVNLDPALEVEGMTFKRAQMLGFRGKPLLQMAYLRDDGVPMALCLVRTDNPDRDARAEEMFDLAGVSWVKDGVGYFLVGGADADRVETISADVIASL